MSSFIINLKPLNIISFMFRLCRPGPWGSWFVNSKTSFFSFLRLSSNSCGKLVSLCVQMGSVIQKEVQHAHLQQIMEDVKMGQLVKAAQHLQYLHEDFGPSESECRFVAMLHFLVAGPIAQFLQDCCSLFIGLGFRVHDCTRCHVTL